jgi:hypothetical protein
MNDAEPDEDATEYQVLEGQVITRVVHGTNHSGYPYVRLTTKNGWEMTFMGDGYNVDPVMRISIYNANKERVFHEPPTSSR